MNHKATRAEIATRTATRETIKEILESIGIDITASYHFKVREESTPSALINKDGSVYDFGSSEYYGDIVALLFDGYKAFNSLTDTMAYLCDYLGISECSA